jgi:CHAT domain-containing protein
VRDDATFFLMWKFYQTYLDDDGQVRQTPASALRTASLWLRDVTIADLAGLFEPVRDDAGAPVPRTIDRNRPRQPYAAALSTSAGGAASLAAPDTLRGPSPATDTGRVTQAAAGTDRFSPAQRSAIDANPAAYILPGDGLDDAAYTPFSNPAFWAAFSITGA